MSASQLIQIKGIICDDRTDLLSMYPSSFLSLEILFYCTHFSSIFQLFQ